MASLPDSRVLLINITGPDKAGVTHKLARILAGAGARILDIGQAVIHDALALGILVEFTGEMKTSPLLAELLLEAHNLGVQLRFEAISGEEYQGWVEHQGKQRFLVSVLAPGVTAEHLAAVSGVLAEAGLNIDRIDRLSGRTPLEPAEMPARVCVELAVSGSLADEDALRAALMGLTAAFDVDVAFQHDNVYRRNRRLVAFDMDSTLIQAEVIDELARLRGVGEEVARITESAMRGELDFQASFRQRVSLLKGLPAAALDRVVESIPLMDGAERLTSTLRGLGYKMAILSGGFTFVGRDLQRRLGIDYLHSNELEIRDGEVTGCVIPPIVDGARKAEMLQSIARQEGLSMQQVIAVGDGANDLPMLGIAGLGIAFRAKPLVRQSARQSISRLGLDGILYLLGVRDRESISGIKSGVVVGVGPPSPRLIQHSIPRTSNSERGRAFQVSAANVLSNILGVRFDLEVPIEIGCPPKAHKFDLASPDRSVVAECKYLTFTESGNIPAAKITNLKEACLYLHQLPSSTRKLLLISRSLRGGYDESLAEYFARLNRGVISDIVVVEVNDGRLEVIAGSL